MRIFLNWQEMRSQLAPSFCSTQACEALELSTLLVRVSGIPGPLL